MTRRPILQDLRLLGAVAGQRYVLARPTGQALAVCLRAQETLRAELADLDVVYPAPHLTLLSFARESELREIQAAVRARAARTRAFLLRLAGVGTFPGRIVYVPVRASEGLRRAARSFAREARARDLPPIAGEAGGRDDWIGHVSLAYCERLGSDDWRRVAEAAARLEIAPVACRIGAVEVISYERDGEHKIGVYGLLGGRGEA